MRKYKNQISFCIAALMFLGSTSILHAQKVKWDRVMDYEKKQEKQQEGQRDPCKGKTAKDTQWGISECHEKEAGADKWNYPIIQKENKNNKIQKKK